jgi:hypothetical protein
MGMNGGWVSVNEASRAQPLFGRRLLNVLRPPAVSSWRKRFVQRAARAAPELSTETLDALASLWIAKRSSMSPEEAAESAVLWVRCGGIHF